MEERSSGNPPRQILSFIATPEDAGKRLDVALLSRLAGWSRSAIQKEVRRGAVLVNGRAEKPGHTLRGGEVVEWIADEGKLRPADVEIAAGQPDAECVDILYEDAAVLAVNKPRGLVVHRGAGAVGRTLVDLLMLRGVQLASQPGADRPGVVHRLDKETSGVLLLAKTDDAYFHLSRQFKERSISKRYLAITNGMPHPPEGVIETFLGRHPRRRQKMSARLPSGRIAVTEYRVLECYAQFALVELIPHTGRTHQLRVHLNHLGHPIVGDPTYGGRKRALHVAAEWKDSPLHEALSALRGQMLHAATITFQTPDSLQQVTVEAPLPSDMANLLDILRTRA